MSQPYIEIVFIERVIHMDESEEMEYGAKREKCRKYPGTSQQQTTHI